MIAPEGVLAQSRGHNEMELRLKTRCAPSSGHALSSRIRMAAAKSASFAVALGLLCALGLEVLVTLCNLSTRFDWGSPLSTRACLA
jgi:hypothetical protein